MGNSRILDEVLGYIGEALGKSGDRRRSPWTETSARVSGRAIGRLATVRVMFAVEDVGVPLIRLNNLRTSVVDETVNYENIYRFCHIRGPEGILIGLAEELAR